MEKTLEIQRREWTEHIAQSVEAELEKMYPPVDDLEYAVVNAITAVIAHIREMK